MALFPVISNFQYDFVLQLVAVDTDNSMDEVAAAAAHHSVGRRVAPRPGKVIRVRRQGGGKGLPPGCSPRGAHLAPGGEQGPAAAGNLSR